MRLAFLERDETPRHLYNPLSEDFKTTYSNDDNVPIEYVIPSQEITTLPAYIARIIAKHLAHHIVMKRGIKTNYRDEYEAELKNVLI